MLRFVIDLNWNLRKIELGLEIWQVNFSYRVNIPKFGVLTGFPTLTHLVLVTLRHITHFPLRRSTSLPAIAWAPLRCRQIQLNLARKWGIKGGIPADIRPDSWIVTSSFYPTNSICNQYGWGYDPTNRTQRSPEDKRSFCVAQRLESSTSGYLDP